MPEQEFKILFDFTTFDLKRSVMTGRSGSILINSKVPKEEIDMAQLKQLCVDEMLRLKPKWNILGLEIKKALPIKSKRPTTIK